MKLFIKQGLPENELTMILVTPENRNLLDWEEDHEFRYKGTMYDIVKIKTVCETSTIYYCIKDNEETKLFAQLDEEVDKRMNADRNGSDSLKNLFKLLSNVYYSQQNTIWISFQAEFVIVLKYFNHYFSPSPDISSPPPKFG